jgi:carboxymethylenebutenolidase
MPVQSHDLTYDAGGRTAGAHLALPEGGTGPGVLVLHAWWGLTPFFKELCGRLAEAGYVALAPDMFEGGTAQTVEEAEVLLRGADHARIEEVVLGALAQLRAQPGVQGGQAGVLGFSFGAAHALVLSAQAPEQVAAVALFYGVYEVDFTHPRAAFLGHFAEQDDFEPLEGVRSLEEALRAAGRDVTFHVYPEAAHWFFEENRPEYRPEHARLAWERTLAFLAQHLREG